MTDTELRELKLDNGKFTLEGRIVEAEPLKLIVVDIEEPSLDYLNREIIEKNEKIKRVKKTSNLNEIEEIENKTSELKQILEEKTELLEELNQYKPKEANAYNIGKPITKDSTGGFGEWGTSGYNHYPILYLRIKNNSGES